VVIKDGKKVKLNDQDTDDWLLTFQEAVA